MPEDVPEGVTITDHSIIFTDENGSTIERTEGEIILEAVGRLNAAIDKQGKKTKTKKVDILSDYVDELHAAAAELMAHYESRHKVIRHPLYQRLSDVLKNKPANS